MFLEFTKRRISVRKDKLDVIIGMEKINKKEVPILSLFNLVKGF